MSEPAVSDPALGTLRRMRQAVAEELIERFTTLLGPLPDASTCSATTVGT